MYLDKALIKGDVNEFVKYGVEIMFPINGFNSSGAQEFADRYINGTLPTQYDISHNSRNILQAIVDYVDIDPSISNILFWGYDNEKLHSLNPNLYFKTLLQGLLSNFIIPKDAKEFSEYVLSQVTIAKSSKELRRMIRDFIGSKYIPNSMASMVDEITANQANWKQLNKTYIAVISALQWKFMEHELSQQFIGTQFEHEFNYVQRLISNYILVNFTAILYINEPGGYDYLFNQINAFVNSTNIKDGYKDLYTLLLKFPPQQLNGNDLTSSYYELSAFFDTTDIVDPIFSKALSELYRMAADKKTSNAEAQFWIEMRQYVNSLNLAPTTRSWFQKNIQQKDIKSFTELNILLYPRTYHTSEHGNTYYTSKADADAIQNFLLLLIDVADKDTVSFGDFTGPYWPSNFINNLNRVALNVKYSDTSDDIYKFSNAILLSINDLYSFQYPFNAYLNITAQILPKIIQTNLNEYYFGVYTWVDGYYDSNRNYVGGHVRYLNPRPEEFVKDSLTIVENTLDTTLNMRDLIDIGQLYFDANKINETTFDGIINFVCRQTKDIAIKLCTVLKMVDSTVSLIKDFINGAKDFEYNSITDIKNGLHLPEFLLFLEDFVDAVVNPVYPKEGATMISAIQATYDYWMASSITPTHIINLTHSVGNLYLLDDNSLQNQWEYTIMYVDEVIYNMSNKGSIHNISSVVNDLTESIITQSPTNTPKPTKIGETRPPTLTPTLIPTSTPTHIPTYFPTTAPTLIPTSLPTSTPTYVPTFSPTLTPTSFPTRTPSATPTSLPTSTPTDSPTINPTSSPTLKPTVTPTLNPSKKTASPTILTQIPTSSPICTSVTCSPTFIPTFSPIKNEDLQHQFSNMDLQSIQDKLSTDFMIVTVILASISIIIVLIGLIDAKYLHPNDIFDIKFVVFPFFYLYDQVSDIFASINIYYEYKYMSITNYNIVLALFTVSISFIIIPSILSLIQLSRAVNKLFITDKYAGQTTSKWMLDYSYLMYLSSIIFGSSFGSLYFLNVM